MWGRLSSEDVRHLLVAMEAILLAEYDAPVDSFFDMRELAVIDPWAYGLMTGFVQQNRERLGALVRRQAQFRPRGMLGAIVQGFSSITTMPYEHQVFSDVEAAFDWLGVDRATGHALLANLERVRKAVAGGNEILGELQRVLHEAPSLSLDEAAQRLGISTRQLQRRLADNQTSYRVQVRTAQMDIAKGLLADESRSVAEIAFEVGFSSAQHFATAFREEAGISPTDWRKNKKTAVDPAP